MPPKKKGVFSSLPIYISFVLILCASCTSSAKKNEQPFNGRLLAESSLMKRRLPLIERENDVLKKESRNLETKIRKMGLELTALDEKYAVDTAAGEERIQSLQQTIQDMEQESTEKIEALTSRTKALEKKLDRKVRSLNEQIAMQKDAFGQDRTQIMQENAKRESNLSSRVSDLKKQIKTNQSQISSLNASISENSTKLGEAAALAEMFRKAGDQSATELESAKAANADLIIKIKELSHDLPIRNGQLKQIHP